MFICTSYNIPLPKSRFNAVCKGSSSFTVTKRLSFLRGFDDTSHSKKGFVGTLQENTAISRKAVGINVHSTIPKDHGIWSVHCSWHCSCRAYFCRFPLAFANIRPWPFAPFWQISLKNRQQKTTHNTFWDCRVPFVLYNLSQNSCILFPKYVMSGSGRTIRKVMGGGRGIFEPREFFFVIKFLVWIFFRP